VPSLSKLQKDLKNVLLYTQQLMVFNDKTIFDLSEQPYPVFYEHQISGLEAVEVNPDAEVWLRMKRLRETPPPEPDKMFDGWAVPVAHPSPEAPPALLDHRLVRLPIEEVSDLMEAGLVVPDDVMRPVMSDEARPAELDVILRPARMPEFVALWREFLEGPWAAWAEAERPRRVSIDFYNRMYQIHQRILSFGDDNPIELVFGLGVARWDHVPPATPSAAPTRVNVPIIEQLVEIELEEDGALVVRPRATQPLVSLKAFHALEVEGSKTLQRDASAELERVIDDPDIGFSPFERLSYEKTLRLCVARLSGSAVYIPDERKDPTDRSLPPVDRVLRVSDSWVLYVRQRADDFRVDDINRLIRQVEKAEKEEDLPAPSQKIVREPSSERLYKEDLGIDLTSRNLRLPEAPHAWSGSGSSGGAAGSGAGGSTAGRSSEAYFFPLPFNDEQIEVIRRLDEADGVIVQGPPGTGKTHTIANIICHYMATGRRVLVAAKTPEALTALQEKLPEGVRDLAISVIHNDREGARQLETAVNILANEAKQVNPRAVREDIRSKQHRLLDLISKIGRIDAELLAYAEKNLRRLPFREQEMLPMELARLVVAERSSHEWLDDDLTLDPRFEPQFTDAAVSEMREIRRALKQDLIYSEADLPEPSRMPSLARVVAGHGGLIRAAELDARSAAGDVPYMPIGGEISLDHVREAKSWLEEFARFIEECRAESWVFDVYQVMIEARPADPAVGESVRSAAHAWSELHGRGVEMSLKAVDVGAVDPVDAAFDEIVRALAEGKRPFGVLSFRKAALKERIAKVMVSGRPPEGQAGWQTVRDYRVWQREAASFLSRWEAVARMIGAWPLPTTWEEGSKEFFRTGRLIAMAVRFSREAQARRAALGKLFPYGVDASHVVHRGDVVKALDAIAANLERAELADAHAVRDEVKALARNPALPFDAVMAEFAGVLGNAKVPRSAVADAWKSLEAEARRLNGLRPSRVRLNQLAAKVQASGAPGWAARLMREPATGEIDAATPGGWFESWQWARANGFIKAIADREAVRRLAEERAETETQQKRLFEEVIRLRTFLGLKWSLTEKVEAALAKFAAAVSGSDAAPARVPSGSGASSARRRSKRRAPCRAGSCRSGAFPSSYRPSWARSSLSSSTRRASRTSPPCRWSCAERSCSSSGTTSRSPPPLSGLKNGRSSSCGRRSCPVSPSPTRWTRPRRSTSLARWCSRERRSCSASISAASSRSSGSPAASTPRPWCRCGCLRLRSGSTRPSSTSTSKTGSRRGRSIARRRTSSSLRYAS
jgi:hypothetical protein